MEQQKLILVVDDDPAFREIFSVKLGSAGYRIETAESGEEGVLKAKQLKPDLILMDMQMLGLTGAETLLKLKEDPELAGMKVLFLSSLGGVEPEVKALNDQYSKELGAIGYMKKSDDLDHLAEKVHAVLSGQ